MCGDAHRARARAPRARLWARPAPDHPGLVLNFLSFSGCQDSGRPMATPAGFSRQRGRGVGFPSLASGCVHARSTIIRFRSAFNALRHGARLDFASARGKTQSRSGLEAGRCGWCERSLCWSDLCLPGWSPVEMLARAEAASLPRSGEIRALPKSRRSKILKGIRFPENDPGSGGFAT